MLPKRLCRMVRGRALIGLLAGAIVCRICFASVCSASTPPTDVAAEPREWLTVEPETAGMVPARFETLWNDLRQRHSTALLVVREDRIVFERYAPGWGRTRPHYTASMAKALVGGVSLMVAMNDGRIRPDDPAGKFVPQWASDPAKAKITVRHLATHTSGIEDAEADGLPHDRLAGWKGDFWKRLAPPKDPFTLARDLSPVLDPPGTRARYSNPGMAMLAYCVTASLRGSTNLDLRALLKDRIMGPLAVPDSEWSVGYGAATSLEGMAVYACWGGGAFSPNAAARVGLLMLHKGTCEGKELISPGIVETATTHADTPNNSGLGWWVNREADGRKHWQAAPMDTFWGAGAGHQLLLVIPSLNLIVVRNGEPLDESLPFDEALETHLVVPLMKVFSRAVGEPCPPSPTIKQMAWSPADTILRKGGGSDNWPLAWADDDALYTAYGDGTGFEPGVDKKLSLGFAKVMGSPPDFSGINIRSATGEQQGDGKAGKKASGILMVEGVLYNATLKRYLWCQTLPGEDPRRRGGFGIYDAPEPWGPWTTVYFTEQWDVGPGETSSFPTKWMSPDGRTLYLVFSGMDSFSVRKASVLLWGEH